MSQRLQKRLEQLIQQAEQILDLTVEKPSEFLGTIKVFKDNGDDLYVQWIVNSKNILKLAGGGEDSIHYESFLQLEKPQTFESKSSVLKRLVSILRACLDDLNNGFLISFKQIIQAEVFDSELEQATYFLNENYKIPAAVIAGVVLETAIKELCINNGIDIYLPDGKREKKLEKLNEDLTKSGIYPLNQQKKVTYYADIRNNAAHGKPENFDAEDVRDMIKGIEKLLMDYLS